MRELKHAPICSCEAAELRQTIPKQHWKCEIYNEGYHAGRRAERADVVAYYRAMSWLMTNGLEVAHAVERGDHVNAAGDEK